MRVLVAAGSDVYVGLPFPVGLDGIATPRISQRWDHICCFFPDALTEFAGRSFLSIMGLHTGLRRIFEPIG